MIDHWPSTKGMGVFNAIKLGGRMTPEQITEYLRAHWKEPRVTQEYVDDGIDFIMQKGWLKKASDGCLEFSISQWVRDGEAFSVERIKRDADLKIATWVP